MTGTTAALVGATGGAGTTRLSVELAATLAREGGDVAVVDAAYATQGLSDYVPGRIDPDVTALVTDETDAPLASGLVDLDLGVPGRVACCPARAPFERLARAKAADAARAFEDRVAEAAEEFDAVLVDTPPVAANQAIAAVNAADRVALVTPASTRGADAVQRMRARLSDLDTAADALVTNFGDVPDLDADATVPESEQWDVTEPSCVDADATLAPGVASVAEAVLGAEVGSGEERLLASLGEFVRG